MRIQITPLIIPATPPAPQSLADYVQVVGLCIIVPMLVPAALVLMPILLLMMGWEWLIARLRAITGWPTESPPPPPSLVSLLRSPKVELSYLPGWSVEITPSVARGILLQLLEATHNPDGPAGTSWLVYLDLKTLQWQRLQETSGYLLENIPDEPDVLRGWLEDGSEVRLHIAETQQTVENTAPEER
ncbi:hypothetical protein [Hymenobacter sediminicola]|uniref:Uncharacterized protein n=1 Tax=Hymenobacter sediminicola TaxID=2761579 RepID=A0A7G7WBR0_9BACT|nr:hypothetical protein [Hymenobacter sediminicola]QNH63803.1 hypothetical protein H4317_08415 [Hymenobacter sediminicola]